MQTSSSKTTARSKKAEKLRHPPDDEEQSKLFIEKAREIEANEEQSAADQLLEQMVKSPPAPRKKPRKK
jgi:hypothetical protein